VKADQFFKPLEKHNDGHGAQELNDQLLPHRSLLQLGEEQCGAVDACVWCLLWQRADWFFEPFGLQPMAQSLH